MCCGESKSGLTLAAGSSLSVDAAAGSVAHCGGDAFASLARAERRGCL